jgi:hypothetical protein
MTTKVFNALAAATTLAGIVATTGAANAASLSYDTSTGLQETDLDTTLSVQKFNSSLGTLNSVILQFTSNLQGNASVTNNSKTKSGIFSFSSDGDVELNNEKTGDTILSLSPSVQSQKITIAALKSITSPTLTASESTTQTFTNASFLKSFIGTGNLNFGLSATALSSFVGTGNFSSTISTYADAYLKVTYDYTAKTVPEPSALLGIGVMAGFGIISKKKKWLKMANS